MNVLQPNPMLRDALLLDGLLSGVTGLLLVLAAGWLGAFLALSVLLRLSGCHGHAHSLLGRRMYTCNC